MARSRAFNLTAELNLRGPSNIGNVVSNIRRQLGNINANVNVVISANSVRNTTQLNTALQRLNATLVTTRNNVTAATNAFNRFNQTLTQFNRTANAQQINNVTRSVNNMGRSAQTASTQMEEFGRQSALAVRRFAAFSTVTSVIFGVTNAIKNGVTAFIDYDKELVRLQQVTGESAAGLKGLSSTITDLATKLGISSSELITVSSTLAQAGLTARDTEKALKALALSSLAPSFDDMNKTVEGSIALMRQFGINAGDLDKALGSVNAVAARFAVEASDIITAIQRTGGVFATASKGVSEGTDALNEFISVFTSIRATTRESAETIATGLRTIFTRIQRESTVDALKGLGIELRNAEGKFVGAYEAVRRLSEGLSKIDPRSAEFAKISEELGGFRQIGKVIPLIQQFATSQEALKVAQKGQGSLARDAITAQLSLANQASKVREEFLALFRDIGSSDTFQTIAKGALDLTSNLIKMADSIKGVLPVLTTMLAFRGAGALAQFGAGFVGGIRGGGRRANGGYIGAYASGGLVPGSGDGDTVPAMLTAGEFVIRKKAVQAIGAGNLHAINGYAGGGFVNNNKYAYGDKPLGRAALAKGLGIRSNSPEYKLLGQKTQEGMDFRVKKTLELQQQKKQKKIEASEKFGLVGLFSGKNMSGESGIQLRKGVDRNKTPLAISYGSLNRKFADQYEKIMRNGINKTVSTVGGSMARRIGGNPITDQDTINKIVKKAGVETAIGTLTEASIGIAGAPFSNDIVKQNASIDFPNGLGSVASLFGVPTNIPTDATRDVKGKGIGRFIQQISRYLDQKNPTSIEQAIAGNVAAGKTVSAKRMSSGGSSQDTVPALLTPGEYVLNKNAASRLGSATLHKLNNADKISGFNKGGSVGGIQHFVTGGDVERQAGRMLGASNIGGFARFFGSIDSQLNLTQRQVTQLGNSLTRSRIQLTEWPALVNRGGNITLQAAQRAIRADINRTRATDTSNNAANRIAAAERILTRTREVGTAATTRFRDRQQAQRGQTMMGAFGDSMSGQGAMFGSLALGMLAGQGETLFGKATTGAGAGRIGGFEKATTTAATGLATASSLAMIPGIGPYLAAIALVTTGLMTISSYFSGASEATKEFEQNLRSKGIENAADRTAKAFEILEKSGNNATASLNAMIALEDERALREKDLSIRIQEINVRARTWEEWLSGTTDINKREEKKSVFQEQASRNAAMASQAQRLIENKLRSGMSIGQVGQSADFDKLAKQIASADAEYLRLQGTSGGDQILARIKKDILEDPAKIAIEASMKQQAAMVAAANAAHKAAMSLDEFSKGLSQGLDRASFELENLKAAEESAAQAISGEAKNRTSTSRNINILQNPSAYSAGERQQALNVATSTLSPANAQMQRTLSTLPNVLENALAANATQFNPSSKFDEKAESSAKTTMGDVIKNMPGLSDELKQNLQRKFDNEVAELAEKVNKNNGTMDDFNAGLKTIVQNLINVDAIQKNNVTMLQLMDNAFNHFVEGLNNNAARLKKANDLMFKAVQIGINGFYALRKALTGVEMSIGEVKDMENRTLSRLTGGPTDPNQIYANIERLRAERASLETQSQEAKKGGDTQAFAQTEIKLKEVNEQLNNNQQALQHLAESTAVADAALRDIEKAKQIREAKTQYVEKIITSGPDELTKMDRTVARLENNLAGRQNIGSFAAREAYQTTLEQTENPVEAMKAAREVMAQERSDTLALFKELRPINEYDLTQKLQQQINPNTGQNYTASEAEVEAVDRMNKQQAELMRQMAIESGTINRPIVQAQIRAVEQGLNSDQMVRKAQAEYIAAVDAQRVATEYLAKQERSLITSIDQLTATLQGNINNIGAQGNAGIENGAPQEGQPRPQRQAQVQPQADNHLGPGRGDGRAGGLIILPAEARAAGGMINFTPRGTDTVPAMLTPGEFVVNRQSAQANMPLLRSINSSGGKAFSMGGVVYAVHGGEMPDQQFEPDPFIRDPKNPDRTLRRKTGREITLEKKRVKAGLPAQSPSIDPKTGALNYAGISGAQPLGMDKNGKPLNPQAVKRVNPLMYWRSVEGQTELKDLAISNPVAAARIVAQLDRATMMEEARKQNTTPRAVNERKPLDQSPEAIAERRRRAAGFETSDEKKNRESRRAEGLATAARSQAFDQIQRGKILARKQGIGYGPNEVSAVNQETGDLAYVDYSNLDAQDQEALRAYMDKQKMEWDKKEREKKDAEIVAKVKERQKTKDDAIAKAEEDKKRQEEKRLSERASGSDRYWASHPEEKAQADKKEAAYQEDLKQQQAQAQAARDAKRVADEKAASEAHIQYTKDLGIYHLTEEGKAEYDKKQQIERAAQIEYRKIREDAFSPEIEVRSALERKVTELDPSGSENLLELARAEMDSFFMTPSFEDQASLDASVDDIIARARQNAGARLSANQDRIAESNEERKRRIKEAGFDRELETVNGQFNPHFGTDVAMQDLESGMQDLGSGIWNNPLMFPVRKITESVSKGLKASKRRDATDTLFEEAGAYISAKSRQQGELLVTGGNRKIPLYQRLLDNPFIMMGPILFHELLGTEGAYNPVGSKKPLPKDPLARFLEQNNSTFRLRPYGLGGVSQIPLDKNASQEQKDAQFADWAGKTSGAMVVGAALDPSNALPLGAAGTVARGAGRSRRVGNALLQPPPILRTPSGVKVSESVAQAPAELPFEGFGNTIENILGGRKPGFGGDVASTSPTGGLGVSTTATRDFNPNYFPPKPQAQAATPKPQAQAATPKPPTRMSGQAPDNRPLSNLGDEPEVDWDALAARLSKPQTMSDFSAEVLQNVLDHATDPGIRSAIQAELLKRRTINTGATIESVTAQAAQEAATPKPPTPSVPQAQAATPKPQAQAAIPRSHPLLPNYLAEQHTMDDLVQAANLAEMTGDTTKLRLLEQAIERRGILDRAGQARMNPPSIDFSMPGDTAQTTTQSVSELSDKMLLDYLEQSGASTQLEIFQAVQAELLKRRTINTGATIESVTAVDRAMLGLPEPVNFSNIPTAQTPAAPAVTAPATGRYARAGLYTLGTTLGFGAMMDAFTPDKAGLAATERDKAVQRQRSELDSATAHNNGGLVYASHGMMVPKGTDTVPAMLTSGEFVVNRDSAQKNLGLLNSINRSRGGVVPSYYQHGGAVDIDGGAAAAKPAGGGAFTLPPEMAALVTDLNKAFGGFGKYVEQLSKVSLPNEITFNHTGTVDVRITGAEALNAFREETRIIVDSAVSRAMRGINLQTEGGVGAPAGNPKTTGEQEE